jgi:hypothetical protein
MRQARWVEGLTKLEVLMMFRSELTLVLFESFLDPLLTEAKFGDGNTVPKLYERSGVVPSLRKADIESPSLVGF